MASPSPPRLLTFAPMVDSETTRLVCRWYGVAYREDDHLFGWVSLLTLRHGGYGRVPLLHGTGLRLSGPRAVVDHFDPLAAVGRRLLPAGIDAAAVEADWAAYNGALAADVAVFAYFHLLAEPALMIPVFAAPVPAGEARMTPRAYPLLRWLFTALLRLTPARAEAAGSRILAVFAAIDRRLADGRPYLGGDRLTLGDIALAGATAPLLQPSGYGARMPPISAMPATIRETIEALRRRVTARHVQDVYRHLSWRLRLCGADGQDQPPPQGGGAPVAPHALSCRPVGSSPARGACE